MQKQAKQQGRGAELWFTSGVVWEGGGGPVTGKAHQKRARTGPSVDNPALLRGVTPVWLKLMSGSCWCFEVLLLFRSLCCSSQPRNGFGWFGHSSRAASLVANARHRLWSRGNDCLASPNHSRHRPERTPPPPPPTLCPSHAYVQATRGIGSVNFCAVDFGSAFFNWSCCVICVLSDAWVLRCRMFIFCVKEADWGMMAFVAYLPLGFQNSTPCVSACTMHSVNA